MRWFQVHEPGEDGEDIVQEVSDEYILATYYPEWQAAMRKVGREHDISPENCIQDWVTVHWAREIPVSYTAKIHPPPGRLRAIFLITRVVVRAAVDTLFRR
jgi:hypothetical protein